MASDTAALAAAVSDAGGPGSFGGRHLQPRPTRPPLRQCGGADVELFLGRGTWSWIVPDGLWEIA